MRMAQLRERERAGCVDNTAQELLVKLHDASGSVIQANSMRLAQVKDA